jgi:hypothetical protein
VHGFDLLFAFGSGILEGLVLVLDSLDLAFDLFLPTVTQVDLSLFVVGFEFADFVEFGLLFDFEEGLFNSLSQEHVKDGLHFAVVVEKIVILDLGEFIDTGFLRDILGGFRSWHKNVGLALDVAFLGLIAALFGEEVGEVNLNASGWAGDQIVRGRLVLLAFVSEELGFNHFDLLALLFFLYSHFILLLSGHVSLDQVHVVSVSTEDSLIVHDVQCFTLIGVHLIEEAIVGGVCGSLGGLVLGFSAEHLGLGSLKSLIHLYLRY